MRILHMNDNYRPFGGAERYLHSLCGELEGSGHQVFKFCAEVDEVVPEINSLVFRESSSLNLRRVQQHSFHPRLFVELRNYIDKVQPDVVHLHNINKYPATLLLAATRNRRAPVVQSVHDYSIVCPRTWNVTLDGEACTGGPGLQCRRCLSVRLVPRIFVNLVRRHLSRNVDAFIVASRDMKGMLEAAGYRNVHQVPYFMDIQGFQPDFGKKEVGRILHVAQLARHKGTSYLLEAMSLVSRELPGARLHIIGGGPEETNLKELARRLGLDDAVTFYGSLWDDERLEEEYQKASVVVISSVWMENTPLVALQAMAAGTPLVANNKGGVAEVLEEGETGFLVDPRHPEQMADRIVRILRDPALAARMGEKAVKKAQEFSKERHVQMVLGVYEQTLRWFRA
ncbi:MAG: glycosyltransferase family 4 protein [Chloroflexota bacterium]